MQPDRLNVRLTHEARAKLNALADAWGCTRTDVLHRLLAAADESKVLVTEHDVPKEDELLLQLAAAARKGNVRATELLLRHRNGGAGPTHAPKSTEGDGVTPVAADPFGEVDELAVRRRRTA